MNNRKGIAYVAIVLSVIGMYFSGSMTTFFFGIREGEHIRSIFDGLILPIYIWIGSCIIGAYGIYELKRDR